MTGKCSVTVTGGVDRADHVIDFSLSPTNIMIDGSSTTRRVVIVVLRVLSLYGGIHLL